MGPRCARTCRCSAYSPDSAGGAAGWPGAARAFSHRSRRGAMSMSRPWGREQAFQVSVFRPVRRALIIQAAPTGVPVSFARFGPTSGARPGGRRRCRCAQPCVSFEEGQAGVEVDILFRLAPHGLLVGPDRGGAGRRPRRCGRAVKKGVDAMLGGRRGCEGRIVSAPRQGGRGAPCPGR